MRSAAQGPRSPRRWLGWAAAGVALGVLAWLSPGSGMALAEPDLGQAIAVPSAAAGAAASIPALAALLRGPQDISGEPGPQSETTIAVDPANPRVVVAGANDLAAAGVAAWSSQDGGAVWQRVEMPLNDAAGEQGDAGTDPSLAVGPHGTFYYSYALMNGDGSAASIVVSSSRDGGRGWSVPAVVTAGLSQGLDNDKDMLAVDNWSDPHRGTLYDVWDQNEPANRWPPQEIMLSTSPPGGRHWSPPMALNLHAGSGEGIYATVAVQPDGAIYVLWDDYGLSDEQSVLLGRRCLWSGGRLRCGPTRVAARSNVNIDGPGPARGNPVDCASEQGPTGPGVPPNDGWDCYAIPPQPGRGIAAAPSICASPDGQLNLVFDTATSPGALNTEVMYTASRDGGRTWSPPVEIDGDRASAYDFFPWIACDPVTGALAVTYYTTRGDAVGRRVQEAITWSLDGGQSWTPPQQVSGMAANESGPGANTNDYGDYEGLSLWRDVAYPVWTGYGGSATRREQVFTAQAPVPVPPPAPNGLTAVPAGPGAEVVRWAPVPGATGYDVYALPAAVGVAPQASASDGAAARLLARGLPQPQYRVQDVRPHGGPTVVVRAVDLAGVGPPSAPLLLPPPAVPAPPGGLVAVPLGSSRVLLSWTPVPQAASYAVYVNGHLWRRTLAAASVDIGGLRPASTDSFQVRAVNALGTGYPSPTVTASTAPRAPVRLRADPLVGVRGGVQLLWSPSPGASGYLVLRSSRGPRGPFALIAITPVPAFLDRPPAAARWWYRVRAVTGGSLPSAPSPTVSVRLPPVSTPG
jgi:hypothetical protein